MYFIHILLASVWIGVTFSIALLANWCFFQADETQLLLLAPFIPRLYQTVLLPTALLIIVQGLIYGLFSSWGFIRHRWIMLKWIGIVLVGFCIGWGAIAHTYEIIARVEMLGIAEGLTGARTVLGFILLQIFLLIMLVWLSIFKPRLRKNKLHALKESKKFKIS